MLRVSEQVKTTAGAAPTRQIQIAGLDTLRFIAAACVALGHGAAFPLSAYVSKESELSRILIGIYNCTFNGIAAVLIFFIISGFCIHYSFASGVPFRTIPFLTRRLIRIVIPVLAALVLAAILGHGAEEGLKWVLWSLYCEMIYYALYPILRLIFEPFGLLFCAGVSFLVSAAVIAFNWDTAYYWEFSLASMTILLLPAWLAGCLLAELIAADIRIRAPGEIWIWRFFAWFYATASLLYYFHGRPQIGLPLLLTPFYLFAFFWLYKEIHYFRDRGAVVFFEWCGKWSYSVYLIHSIVIGAFPYQGGDPFFPWVIRLAAIVAGSLAFYFLVEFPSHKVAQIAARRVNNFLLMRLSKGASS